MGYADRCTATCPSGGANNRDAYATIARQSGGLTLRSANDPRPNLTISALSATVAANGASTVTARMSNVGTAGATAPVRFLVDGKVLLTSTARTVGSRSSVTVTAAWRTTGVHGAHTISAVADQLDVVTESNEGDNRRSASVRLA